MGKPRHSRGRPVEDLRLTIDCMPVSTRQAMLEGVQSNERIIVGAYVDRAGGVCPMLAAHRCGGRTDLLSFARAWDRFARAGPRARRASRRELDILLGQLKDSLESSNGQELDRAIAEHRELAGRRIRPRRRLPEGADPSGEIRARRLSGLKGRIQLGDNPAHGPDRQLSSPVSSRG
jgi:hypothetical protein